MKSRKKADPASALMEESWTLFNDGHELAAVATARMLFESVLRSALDEAWRSSAKNSAAMLLRKAYGSGRISRRLQRDVDLICGRLSEVIHGRQTTVPQMEGLLTMAESELRKLVAELRASIREGSPCLVS